MAVRNAFLIPAQGGCSGYIEDFKFRCLTRFPILGPTDWRAALLLLVSDTLLCGVLLGLLFSERCGDLDWTE
jgi:hypothetical protein